MPGLCLFLCWAWGTGTVPALGVLLLLILVPFLPLKVYLFVSGEHWLTAAPQRWAQGLLQEPPRVWLGTPPCQQGAACPSPVVPPSKAPCPVSAGDVLFQMAEVHRQIQNQLEEMVSAQPGMPGSLSVGKAFLCLVQMTPAPLAWIC